MGDSNRLTARERQIAAAIADGLTNREIATALDITVDTVKTHTDRIFMKLGLRNRTLVAVWWVKYGFKPCAFCDLDIPTTNGEHLIPDPNDGSLAHIPCPHVVKDKALMTTKEA